MVDPVTDALARIAERRGGSFAVVSDRSRPNLYAQFLTDDDTAALYGELVGDDHLPEGERLTAPQQDALRARGWVGDGAANWARTWPDASTEEARRAIALEALGALRDVYGAAGDVEVEVHLEAPEAPTAEPVAGRTRLVLLAGVALGLLAVVAALLASL